MALSIGHTKIEGTKPHWYTLERWDDGHLNKAIRVANSYALDHGGYVNVTDKDGHVLFGTDPAALDSAIKTGQNKYFTQPSI